MASVFRHSKWLNSLVFFLLLGTNGTAEVLDKSPTPSIEEAAKEGLITKDQERILQNRKAMEENLENSLQSKKGVKDLTPGELALALQTQSESPDMACISNTGALKVAIVNDEAPPFIFTNSAGELDGIDVRLAEAIAKDMGVKLELIKLSNQEEVVNAVINKKANFGISKLNVTSELSRKIRYAGKYVTMSKALLVNRIAMTKINKGKNLTVNELFQLPEATIGVIRGSPYETYAKNLFPKATLKTYPNWESLLDAIKKGEILAAFRDDWDIRKAVQKSAQLGLFTTTIVLKDEEDSFQMIVPWSSQQFAHYLDQFVKMNAKYQYSFDKLEEAYANYQQQLKEKKTNG